MVGRWFVIALTVLAACGQDRIDVRPGGDTDYNHHALQQAVDQFVTAGRTPAAFRELSKRVLDLRSGMDRTVAHEAELRLRAAEQNLARLEDVIKSTEVMIGTGS